MIVNSIYFLFILIQKNARKTINFVKVIEKKQLNWESSYKGMQNINKNFDKIWTKKKDFPFLTNQRFKIKTFKMRIV